MLKLKSGVTNMAILKAAMCHLTDDEACNRITTALGKIRDEKKRIVCN